MAERITGISLADVRGARQDVVSQQRSHAAEMTNPRRQLMLESTRYQAKLQGRAEELRVRNMILTEVGRQGGLLTPDATAPVFHPDVLSSDFDPQIARGEIMPVMVPFGRTNSGLEVPLYTIDAQGVSHSSPLGELVEDADPEHTPVAEVMKIVKGEGPAILEKMGQDPELTAIRVVNVDNLRTIFDTGAVAPRKTVTSTPSRYAGEMVTFNGSKIGHHPAHENSVPTKLVIAKRMPTPA